MAGISKKERRKLTGNSKNLPHKKKVQISGER
jgi:hypothetical protein